MTQQPFFLVGSERSGTTLLRLMLAHHPRIACASEFEYAVDMVSDSGARPALPDYWFHLEHDRIFAHDGHTIDRTLDYPSLVQSFLDQFNARRGDRPIVGATVHRHFDRLLHLWPDARFVHIVRDGRDVARSCIQMGWAGNVWTGSRRWVEAETLWADVLRPKLSPDRFIDVTYEAVVGEPERELTRICEFLGTAFDPAMFSYADSTTYERPDPKLIAQWKRKLLADDIRLAEARIGGMLKQRGYELSGLPPLEVTPAMEARLRRQDRVYRVRHRVKVMGPPLFVADYVTRHLGLKALQARVKDRINVREAATIR